MKTAIKGLAAIAAAAFIAWFAAGAQSPAVSPDYFQRVAGK